MKIYNILNMWFCIGVDVGGINIDVVIFRRSEVLSLVKVSIIVDVIFGIIGVIRLVLGELLEEF